MRPFATLSLAALISLFSSTVSAGDPQAGASKAAPCAVCHGQNGNSDAPSFPRLAGQHESYLAESLKQYRSGARKNAIMNGQAANLSDRDIADLAAFYARQDGVLFVPGYSVR